MAKISNTSHLIDNLSGLNMLFKELRNIQNWPSFVGFSEIMCKYTPFLNRVNGVTAVSHIPEHS